MSNKHIIRYVTSNESKFQEAKEFFDRKSNNIELVRENMDLFEIQTKDQKIIALHKAEEAWQKVSEPLIVEDTGIYLQKYREFPGTLTKQVFKGIGYRGLFRLVDSGDKATFTITIVYVDKNGNPHVFEGDQEGQIVRPGKFEMEDAAPFNPIFVPEGSKLSYKEMKEQDPDLYAKNSHRLKTLNAFIEWFNKAGIHQI